MPVNRSADCIVDHIILAQNIMFFTTTHKTARSLWQKHFKHRVGELTSWIFRCRSASEEEHETREDSSSSKEGAPSHGWAMRYLVLGGLQKDHTDFYEMLWTSSFERELLLQSCSLQLSARESFWVKPASLFLSSLLLPACLIMSGNRKSILSEQNINDILV